MWATLPSESTLATLYRELAPFDFDYEPIPAAVTSYQGETVAVHQTGEWCSEISLYHVGDAVYTLRLPARYVAHPVLEYAIRATLVNLIARRTPARVYAYTARIDQMAVMDDEPVESEQAFTQALRKVVSEALIAGYDDRYLQAALRRLIANAVEEGIWGFDESLWVDVRAIGQKPSNNYLRVTTLDHEHGPFVQHEIQAIAQGLEDEAITVEERVMVRLLMGFGLRPIQLRLLREDDVLFDAVKEEHYLRVPRVKGKRARHRRKRFTTRGPLAPELVADIQAMIGGERRPTLPRGCARALFRAQRPHPHVLAGPFREYAYHANRSYVGETLRRVENKLNVVSHYTGERLNLTAYRFRYTIATNMVLSGCSPADVAMALDHDSLESVHHYFRYTDEVAEYLDATVGRSKGHQLASAKWAGFVDEDYPDGSTIRLDAIANLGKCLKNAPCPYHPAVSCYGCGQFKPFRHADHAAALVNIETLARRYRDASSGPLKQQLDHAADQAKRVVAEQRRELVDG